MIYADNWNPPLPQLQKPISQHSETYSSKFQNLLNDSKTNKNLSVLFKEVDTSQLMQALNSLDKLIATKIPKQGGFDIDDVEINTTGLLAKELLDFGTIQSIVKTNSNSFSKPIFHKVTYDPKGQIPFPKEQPIIFIDDLANEEPF